MTWLVEPAHPLYAQGGKLDDITVLVAVVDEEPVPEVPIEDTVPPDSELQAGQPSDSAAAEAQQASGTTAQPEAGDADGPGQNAQPEAGLIEGVTQQHKEPALSSDRTAGSMHSECNGASSIRQISP